MIWQGKSEEFDDFKGSDAFTAIAFEGGGYDDAVDLLLSKGADLSSIEH